MTFLATSVTVTGSDGAETAQETSVLTQVPVNIIVSDPATVYAPPINGYNIVRGRATSGGGGTASDTATVPTGEVSGTGGAPQPSEAAQSGGLAAGAIAGIVVGVVLGLGLLLAGAFLVWRRRRRSPPVAVAETHQSEPGLHDQQHPKMYYGSPPYIPVMSEMPVDSGASELEHTEHSPYTYELPSGGPR